MIRILLLIAGALLASFFQPAQAQLTVIEAGKEKTIDVEANPESLLRYYASLGFFAANIDSIKNTTAWVRPGCGYELSAFRFTGVNGDESGVWSSYSGQYNRSKVEELIHERKEQLIREAYLNARAEVADLKLNDEACEVSIEVKVNPGNPVSASGIIFTGSSSYSQEYLERISRYEDPFLLTEGNLKHIQAELIESGLFRKVSEGELFTSERDTLLVYALEEQTLNRFDGILGYAPDAAGNGRIVGSFNAGLWNVFREGNGIDVAYQRLRPETSRLTLGASQYWFGSLPVSLGLGFSIYQNDSTYQTRHLQVSAGYHLTPRFRIEGGLRSVRSSSNSELSSSVEPDGRKRGTHLGFTYSQLDRPEIPMQGYRLQIDMGFYNKDIEGDSAAGFSQRQLSGLAESYVPLGDRSVLAMTLEGYYISGKRLTESDLIRFGGAESFRGYAEEQFLASRLLWGDLEYRFFVDDESYLFGFGTVGGYKMTQQEFGTDIHYDFLYSTGFGISYRTRVGRLKFSYAISPEESLGNGKVHVGVVTSL